MTTNLSNTDREALAKVAEVAAYLVSHDEPELGVALGVYFAKRHGFPVNPAEICKELMDLAKVEKEGN